jgi:hypothetical protein
MNGRFDRFTERARKVLTLAQEEAHRFNHNYIGTEHLLLGLVREGEGVAAKVFAGLGVELSNVRSEVEFIIGRGDRTVVGEIGLTPRAKKVIELAVDEARRLGHHYIGTEHLLLGLIREGEGIAAGVLESLGVNLERARDQTLRVLRAGPSLEAQSQLGPMPVPGRLRAFHLPGWEYLTLSVIWRGGVPTVIAADGGDDPRFTGEQNSLYAALRTLGEEGWELLAIDTSPLDASLYVFKRHKR